ncbi:MAG: hypothetical protein NTY41_08900 [Proteobacteria bacterium]|nr:hypothetical protein [Pseudomonadota bacterium]
MNISALKKNLLRLTLACLICGCVMFAPAFAQADGTATASAAALSDTSVSVIDLPQAQLTGVLADMLRDERVYAGNPDFDYVLGVVALKAEANTIALHALERVVLQSPERAGAWVDLAIAHARLGETETAATLLDYVEQTFPVPPALRTALDNARRQLLAMRLAGGWHGEFSASIGHDSNANSGLGIDRLTLTLDGVPAEFLIAPEFRVRSDAFMQLGGRLRRAWDTTLAGAQGRFMLTGTAKAKDYRSEKNFNLGDATLQAVYQQPALGGEAEVSVGTQQIRLGGESLVNIRRLQLAWGRRLAELVPGVNCRLQAGPENELRSYPDRHYLDGGIHWLGLQLICATAGSDTALSLRAGNDDPDAARPGGKTSRSELTLVHRTGLWQQFSGEFSLSAARSNDADGYSPVLDGNSRRHIDRYYANAVVYWPVSYGVEALASLEVSRQDSNIAIFDQSGRVFMLGARYRF